ncbi:MAG TPA: lysophospholipid acyltransferase family protein [Acidimicrobiales bacterium]|nr:lysophospholipid acyltransferase family protein [Acidimicrobiales bacterium]
MIVTVPSTSRHLRRRAVALPAAVLSLPILVVLAPLAVPLAALVDLVLARRRWPSLRIYGGAVNYGALETAGLLASGGLWLATGFGLWIDRPWSRRAHHRLQVWWAGQLRATGERWAGIRLEIEGDELMEPGPLLVLPRHASVVDALLPSWMCGVDHDLRLRYVLKDELLWVPCLDVVGNRLPNHFIDRDGGAGEIDAIRHLGTGLGDDEVVIIFPEGTFPTPALRRKLPERLARRDPELAELAAGLRHLLPPRPGGTLALLDATDDVGADVVLIAHVGLEVLTPVTAIWRRIPLCRPVQVKVWRIPRHEIPVGLAERRRWLLATWQVLDDWVDAATRARATPAPRGRLPGTDTEDPE